MLVVICYDALFSDVIDEAKQADQLVVVSNLSDLKQTPFPTYYLRYVTYLHFVTGKPVIYRDQLSFDESPVT